MNKHFIKNIEIKNFKCFDNFKAEKIGAVNLIAGKNNVGKTSLLEACYLCLQNTKHILIQTFMIRNKRNYLYYNKNIELNGVTKPLKDLFNQKFIIKINNNKIFDYKIKNIINSNDYSHRKNINDIFETSKENIQFLDNGVTDKQLEKFYAILQERNKESILNNYINELDPSIKNFKFIQSLPKLQIGKKYIHLSSFGDGLKTYISIICSIYACKNGQLFIDEIENGLHYSRLDRLWEIILTISKQQNVQVFITSHSKECIESYARVGKKLKYKQIKFIELGKNDKNKITSITYDFEALITEIEQNQEIRGW